MGKGVVRVGHLQGFVLKGDRPLKIGKSPGENFHEGAFTGPIGADQAMHFSGPQLQADLMESLYPGVGFGDIFTA